MGVGVDEPGEHQTAPGVDRLRRRVRRTEFFRLPDGDDLPFADGDRPAPYQGSGLVDGQDVTTVHQQIDVPAHAASPSEPSGSSPPYSSASSRSASSATTAPRSTPRATTSRCGS